jgi:hypothetical protein
MSAPERMHAVGEGLGSFTSRELARHQSVALELREGLRDDGYSAWIEMKTTETVA